MTTITTDIDHEQPTYIRCARFLQHLYAAAAVVSGVVLSELSAVRALKPTYQSFMSSKTFVPPTPEAFAATFSCFALLVSAAFLRREMSGMTGSVFSLFAIVRTCVIVLVLPYITSVDTSSNSHCRNYVGVIANAYIVFEAVLTVAAVIAVSLKQHHDKRIRNVPEKSVEMV